MRATRPRNSQSALLPLAFAVAVRMLLSLYWISRFGGIWIEDDTSRMTAAIQSVLNSGHLVSSSGRIYHNGFLHSAYGAILSLITGVGAVDVQTWMFLPVALGLTLLAFVFYRRVLGNPVAAAAATVMLNLQGDLLFTTSRGTHEKLSYTLIFISLLAMAQALSRFNAWRHRLALALVYYLAIFSLSTTNAFFASTFTVALIISSLVGATLTGRSTLGGSRPRWMIYVAIASLIFIYLGVFVLYPPALLLVRTASNLFARLSLFLLSFDEPPADVYQVANQAWIFPQAWVILRLFDLALIALAALGWLGLARRWRREKSLARLFPTGRFLLMIWFPAFAVLNALALASDLTGSASDIKNLQVRLAPLTTLVAAPLAVHALQRLFSRLRARRAWRRLATAGLIVLMIVSTGMALVKSTSEPLLSNVWLFYTPGESAGVQWLDDHAPLHSFQFGRRTPRVWVGPDVRLGPLWLNHYWGHARDLIPATADEPYQFALLSPAVRLLAARQGRPLPPSATMLRVYDNGAVQLYLKPRGER